MLKNKPAYSPQQLLAASIEFLFLHEALKKSHSLEKMAARIFTAKTTSRENRLSIAKGDAEAYLTGKHQSLKVYGNLTLPQLCKEITTKGIFESGIHGMSFEAFQNKIEEYSKVFVWNDLKKEEKPGKSKSDRKFEWIVDGFKTAAQIDAAWSGLEFKASSHKEELDTDEICYVFTSSGQNSDFEALYKGIFILQPNNQKVIHQYFENSKDTSKPSLDITGKIVGEGTVAHFIFEPKGSGMRIFSIQRGDSDWNVPPQYLRGTYSYVHAGEPSVGEIFLQYVTSIETAKKEHLGKHAPAEAQSMLLFKKISVAPKSFSNNAELPTHQILKSIANIQGLYRGYYLSTKDTHLIYECLLFIREDGKATLWPNWNDQTSIDGPVRYKKTSYLIRFGYMADIDLFKSFLNLKKDPPKDSEIVLRGTFGFPNSDGIPGSGRAIFKRIGSTIEEANAVQLNAFDVHDQVALKSFYQDPFSKNVLSFLKGLDLDSMSDDPYPVFLGSDLDMRKDNFQSRVSGNKSAGYNYIKLKLDSDWVGIYEFYIFQPFPNEKFRLHRMRMSMDASGEIKFFSDPYHYEGVVFSKDDSNSILAAISKVGHSESDIFLCFQHMFNNATIAFGTYAGFGQLSERQPTGGRLMAFKLDITDIEKTPPPKTFDLSIESERQKLLQERPELLDYFLGYRDTIVGSYKMFESLGLVPQANLAAKSKIEELKGCYRFIKLTGKHTEIADSLLVISAEGNVTLTSIDGENVYRGVISMFLESILAFNFYRMGDKDSCALSLFTKTERNFKTGEYMIGLHISKVLDHPQAYCARSVLHKVSDNPAEANTLTPLNLITIPTSREGNIYQLYEEKNKRYNNALNYLIGPDSNFLKGPKGRLPEIPENGSKSFVKDIDYGLLFFLGARYYASYNNREKMKKYWSLAKLNGFANDHLVDAFINTYSKEVQGDTRWQDEVVAIFNNRDFFILPNDEQ